MFQDSQRVFNQDQDREGTALSRHCGGTEMGEQKHFLAGRTVALSLEPERAQGWRAVEIEHPHKRLLMRNVKMDLGTALL